MRHSLLLAVASALLIPEASSAAVVERRLTDEAESLAAAGVLDVLRRATAQAPDGYAPAGVTCPSTRPVIRDSTKSTLSPQEKEWLPRRRTETISHIQDFLKRVSIPDFDSTKYLANVASDSPSLPNIGIAVSGGGYRAMLNGAGGIAAFDSRSPGSTNKGNLGGLLQSATYLSGLSGGGWLVGSIYTNNFTTVQAAVASKTIWQFDQSIFAGPKGTGILDYYSTVLKEADQKHDAGFNRSITDYWGRTLSFQLVDAKDGGPAYTFSSIADDPDFSSAKTPLPFLVADSRAPDDKNVTVYNTLFEFNPWEMGSSDPTLHGFAPLKFTGSKFDKGEIPDSEKCINGFDNVGYVMGTSSSLFNQIILQLQDPNSKDVPKDIPKSIMKILLDVLKGLSSSADDIADWTPNPFKGFSSTFDGSKLDRLTLVDGGEDGQNVPFHPHLSVERKVDVVFAVDSSADINAWPNGAAPMNTYRRSLDKIANGTSFPVVPGRNTFMNLGLNTKPTFFGCNSTNTTIPAPLIVYLPNYPFIYQANTSTFQMTYNDSERDAIISNGWAAVTQLNSTRFKDWDVCVGCAMLHRSFERTKTTIPKACNTCFQEFCWNGTIDESEPATTYAPKLFSTAINTTETKGKEGGAGRTAAASMPVLAALAALALVL